MTDFDPFGDAPRASRTQTPRTGGWEGRSPWGDDEAAQSADGAAVVAAHPVGRVLIVCTGNVCRSPYVERRLRAALDGTGIDVHSAGTGALVDSPIDPGSHRLLTELGIAADDFRARQLEPDMVRESGLVLTATREHRSETTRLARTGLDRTFALVDFADLVRTLGADDVRQARGDNAVARLVAAALRHRPSVHARVDGADVPDPFRRGPREFVAMQKHADPAVDVVAAALRMAVSA